jgi:phosphonate transport system permease protein
VRTLDDLRRDKPRDVGVRATIAFLVALVVYAWTCGDLAFSDFDLERRMANLERFVHVELAPFPLREGDHGLGAHLAWARDLALRHGLEGAWRTLCLATAAIVLAAVLAWVLSWFAASTMASARPFQDAFGRGGQLWWLLRTPARFGFVFLRAIPEYVWAFLLLATLGPGAWPVVLALAIHNAGILGRLTAETLENLPPRPLQAARGLGASRIQLALLVATPASFSRFLLYVFYRFETCVREATVLGMLGVVSLGYWIEDARTKQYYDEMAFYLLFGGALVLVVDLLSALARRIVRRQG